MSLELVHPTLVHPRTGEPLRAVGVVAGKPVWPVMGGDGSEADANDNGDSDGDNDGDDNDQDDQDTGDNDGDQDDQDQDGDGDEDARVKRANRQAANYRTQLRESQQQLEQTNELLTRLRTAITGEDGEGEGDPAEQVTQLTGQVESLTTNNQQLQTALLVHDLATDANADPKALLDSKGFEQTVAKLDANADDYRTQVLEAMRKAVSSNSAYRAGQGSSRGGAELNGEQRERQAKRPKGGLSGAIGAHYGGK